jgi:uncharacterized membrane protein YfcA
VRARNCSSGTCRSRLGRALGKKLPEKLIRYGAALIFLVSGVFTLAEAWTRR